MSTRTRAGGIVIVCLLAGIAAQGISAAPADAALPAPKRIAAIARLAIGPKSPAGLDLIRTGLGDNDPAVRAAAARVTNAMALGELLPELQKALSTEDDREAAQELAWALAGLDGTNGSDAVLLGSVARLPEPVIVGLVAGRGTRLAALWGALKNDLDVHPRSVIRGLRDGLNTPAGPMFASFAIRDGLTDLFPALLFERSLRLPFSVAVAALGSDSSRIRSAAYFSLAESGVLLKIETLPPFREAESLGERINRHLFEAAAGVRRTDNLDALVTDLRADGRARTNFKSWFWGRRSVVRGLSAEERRSLLTAADLAKEEVESVVAEKFEAGKSLSNATPADQPIVLKTLGGHPREFARSVIAAAGCRGKERLFDGVEAIYRVGGRPRLVSPMQSKESASGCEEAAHILGATALVTEGHGHILGILPERPEYLACLVESTARPVASGGADPRAKAVVVSAGITEPRKVRNVAPRYPVGARDSRIQGIVILEAGISATGCVSSIRVLRGVDPRLDLEAMDAVSGWRYTPTLLNGVPVPVSMTVTVNFRLD